MASLATRRLAPSARPLDQEHLAGGEDRAIMALLSDSIKDDKTTLAEIWRDEIDLRPALARPRDPSRRRSNLLLGANQQRRPSQSQRHNPSGFKTRNGRGQHFAAGGESVLFMWSACGRFQSSRVVRLLRSVSA